MRKATSTAETGRRAVKRKPAARLRGKPTDVDRHVGARVRQRRTLLGLTQAGLGDALGVTFQQVQKYERGSNRIGAGRLYALSRALDVSVAYFFEDLGEAGAIDGDAPADGRAA